MRIDAELTDCRTLEKRLNELDVYEVIFLDTNVAFRGAFPNLEKKRYMPKFQKRTRKSYRKKRRSFVHPEQSWRERAKHPYTIWNWVKNWHSIGKNVAPVITDIVYDEFCSVYGKYDRDRKPLRKMFNEIDGSKEGLYVMLRGEGELPEKVVDTFKKHSKNRRVSNDVRLLGTAFSLGQETKLRMGLVSNDWDFNTLLEMELKRHKTADGRYVKLENSKMFTHRLQLKLVKPPKPKKKR